MKYVAGATAALLASTSIASAELSRAEPSVRLLFEDVGPMGGYAELSFANVNPKAGTDVVPDPLPSYQTPGFGVLQRLNEQVSFALIYDRPYGADVGYPGFAAGATVVPGLGPIPNGPPFFGGRASVDSRQLTVTGRYELENGFSVYAGLRALEVEGEILTGIGNTADLGPSLGVRPIFNELEGTSEPGFGYLFGAAYELPDIALRVSLTYHSAIEVDFEDFNERQVNQFLGGTLPSVPSDDFSVEFPESWTLEFESGIAPETLVFGSVHHEFWDGFNLTTDQGEYVSYSSDTTTYNVGVGRRFTENWAGSIAYTHRTKGTRPSDTALSPTTGLDSIALAGSYTMDAVTISGGITYGIPGDQVVNSPIGDVDFDDNEVIGFGLRVGYSF
jgi:long-subunit fatty acid transport protein